MYFNYMSIILLILPNINKRPIKMPEKGHLKAIFPALNLQCMPYQCGTGCESSDSPGVKNISHIRCSDEASRWYGFECGLAFCTYKSEIKQKMSIYKMKICTSHSVFMQYDRHIPAHPNIAEINVAKCLNSPFISRILSAKHEELKINAMIINTVYKVIFAPCIFWPSHTRKHSQETVMFG